MAILEARILRTEDTNSIFTLATRAAGTTIQLLGSNGNSLVSSVFIKAADAGTTVKVNYFQTTTGTFVDDAERLDLTSHPLLGIADVGDTNQILATRVHNKPACEVIVSGPGTITFGVYVSVRSETASDLDSALQLDGATLDLVADKGILSMCYDEDLGQAFFIRCKEGKIQTSVSELGDLIHLVSQTISTPGIEQTLITSAVPAGKIRKLSTLVVTCRQTGKFTLEDGSAIIASGRTGSSSMNSRFTWQPRQSAAAAITLTLKFKADGTSPASDVEAYLMASDEDV